MGFDNINMDLIVGLPGEEKADVEHTLQEVISLDPDSITVHSLAVKRASRLKMFHDEYKEMTFTEQPGDHGYGGRNTVERGRTESVLSVSAEKYGRQF